MFEALLSYTAAIYIQVAFSSLDELLPCWCADAENALVQDPVMNLPRHQRLRIHDCFSSLCLTQMYSGKLLPSPAANRSLASLSSPRPLITATAGSNKSRMGKTACLQFLQLREYQKKKLRVQDLTFSASTAAKNSSKVVFFALIQDFISTTKWKHICTSGPRTEQPRSQTSAKCVYSCIIDLSLNTHSKVGFFLHKPCILVQQNKWGLPKKILVYFFSPLKK